MLIILSKIWDCIFIYLLLNLISTLGIGAVRLFR